jgi:hypothetical protein
MSKEPNLTLEATDNTGKCISKYHLIRLSSAQAII